MIQVGIKYFMDDPIVTSTVTFPVLAAAIRVKYKFM